MHKLFENLKDAAEETEASSFFCCCWRKILLKYPVSVIDHVMRKMSYKVCVDCSLIHNCICFYAFLTKIPRLSPNMRLAPTMSDDRK